MLLTPAHVVVALQEAGCCATAFNDGSVQGVRRSDRRCKVSAEGPRGAYWTLRISRADRIGCTTLVADSVGRMVAGVVAVFAQYGWEPCTDADRSDVALLDYLTRCAERQG